MFVLALTWPFLQQFWTKHQYYICCLIQATQIEMQVNFCINPHIVIFETNIGQVQWGKINLRDIEFYVT